MLLFGNIACVHGKDIPNGRGTDSQQCSKTESSGPETVVAKGVKTREELDRWKEAYVAKHYPGYEISDEEMEILGKESIMEILYLDNGKGDAVKLHVNITEYIKKFRQKNRQEIARMIKQQKKVNREEVQGLSYEFPIDLKHAVTEESVLEAQKSIWRRSSPSIRSFQEGYGCSGKKSSTGCGWRRMAIPRCLCLMYQPI